MEHASRQLVASVAAERPRPCVTDSQGRSFRFSLTSGHIANITAARELAAKLPSNTRLIGDIGYDAKKLWENLAFRGTATVIPTNPTHKHQRYID